jgi:hypothetical protein
MSFNTQDTMGKESKSGYEGLRLSALDSSALPSYRSIDRSTDQSIEVNSRGER